MELPLPGVPGLAQEAEGGEQVLVASVPAQVAEVVEEVLVVDVPRGPAAPAPALEAQVVAPEPAVAARPLGVTPGQYAGLHVI